MGEMAASRVIMHTAAWEPRLCRGIRMQVRTDHVGPVELAQGDQGVGDGGLQVLLHNDEHQPRQRHQAAHIPAQQDYSLIFDDVSMMFQSHPDQ